MTWTDEELRRVARLSRLQLSEAEMRSLATELDQIVQFVQQLQEVDVTGVEPLSQTTAVSPHHRADEAMAGVGRAGLRDSAGYEEGLIRVPRIVE